MESWNTVQPRARRSHGFGCIEVDLLFCVAVVLAILTEHDKERAFALAVSYVYTNTDTQS